MEYDNRGIARVLFHGFGAIPRVLVSSVAPVEPVGPAPGGGVVSTADCLWARMEGGAPPAASPASVVRAALAAPVAAVAEGGATRSTSRGRKV